MYEYEPLEADTFNSEEDWGIFQQIQSMAAQGWRLCQLTCNGRPPEWDGTSAFYAIMEREVVDEDA